MCPLGYFVQSLFSAVLLSSEMLERYVIKTILAVGCIKCWQGGCSICIFLPVMFLFIKCSFISQQEDLRLFISFFWHKLSCVLAFRFCCWQLCSVLELLLHLPPPSSVQGWNNVSSQLGNAKSLREA